MIGKLVASIVVWLAFLSSAWAAPKPKQHLDGVSFLPLLKGESSS